MQWKRYRPRNISFWDEFRFFLNRIFVLWVTLAFAYFCLKILPYSTQIVDQIRNNLIFDSIVVLLIAGLIIVSCLIGWVWIKNKQNKAILISQNKRHEELLALNKFHEIAHLDWRSFEEFIEAVLRKKGFQTILWPWKHDWWVDITAILDWQQHFIQCKHYRDDKIGVEKIRELNGVVMGQETPTRWVFVTTTSYTIDALSEAKKYGIELWDDRFLKNLLAETQYSHQESITGSYWICKECWWKMLERTAKNGSHAWEHFLGCENYPKCMYIKKL